MLRCLSMDQKILYQTYEKLGKEVTKEKNMEKRQSEKMIWTAIAKQGIWRLPINKEFGGQGRTWQDCMVALEGFFCQYSNTKFLDLLISQMSSIFLISQYGTTCIKQRYLPRLMQGEIISLNFSDGIYQLLATKLAYPLKENILSFGGSRTVIYAEKINKNIIFTIHEKQLTIEKKSNKFPQVAHNNNYAFISKNIGLSALIELINFKRLLYGILSATYFERLKTELSF